MGAFAASLTLAACGGEGGAGVPAPLASTGADASTDVSADVIPDAADEPEADVVVTPKRTVVTRNPFGNVAKTGNLLLDGDFEWVGGYTSQYPWIMITPGVMSFEAPETVVGFQCRSGMRCASLGVSGSMGGIGLRTQAPYLKVSAWTRPPDPDCTDATFSLGACFHSSNQPLIEATSPTVDPDGWCHYESIVEAPAFTPCLFVSNDLYEDAMLLDDVVIEPSDTAEGGQRSARKPGAKHLVAVERVREGMRAFMKPKPPAWAEPRLNDRP
jgi:hypothetical protein